MLQSPPTEAAVSIPENALHAVSVSLPLWKHNIAYEEGDPEISAKIKSGYPRFKIHYKTEELAAHLEKVYGRDNERAMLFPIREAARRCRDFIQERHPEANVRVVQLSCPKPSEDALDVKLAAVFFPGGLFSVAKQYWQHTGEGISSRHAQYFHERLKDEDAEKLQKDEVSSNTTQPQEIFVEERFGRYLSVSLAREAKPALKIRISEEITKKTNLPVSTDDVYLFSSGMTAIFSSYRVILELDQAKHKAVCYGFPYTDTLKILEKWGPGCEFFRFGDDERDLPELERRLESGDLKISSLYCEVPSNPLLNTPNLAKLRQLADKYEFIIVVDDTVGNMANINTISYADICVSSLTKLFSGDCNVMAGDLVLNPKSRYYSQLKEIMNRQFVDAFWAEDAIYLERNSRDFYDRNRRINSNAEAVVELLLKNKEKYHGKLIKDVNYPRWSASKANYDAIKHPDGGYGGLLSIVFQQKEAAIAFYDSLFIAKGPSLGTNFTLGCPYTIIAHYQELDFAEECGVDSHLVRISVGLEEPDDLRERFQLAIDAAEHSSS